MPLQNTFAAVEPSRSAIDALGGAVVVEFGTPWCGFCRAAQPLIASAFAEHPDLHHIKVEDGTGQPLGRSFAVKLWPTLIFLRGGREMERLVRPADASSISRAMAAIEAGL